MWLLLFVKLALIPEPHVVEVEIMEFFDSEKKCIQKIKEDLYHANGPMNLCVMFWYCDNLN